MTLEALLHQWQADEAAPGVVALAALLPASKIVTGQWQTAPQRGEGAGESEDFPYASLSFEGEEDAWRTNCGEATRTNCRLRVWSPVQATIAAIRDALLTVLHWKSYAGAGRAITEAKRTNAYALQEEDGVWMLVFDFLVIHAPT